MKKYIFIIIGLLFGLGITVFAAPPYTPMRTILPELGGSYSLGSSTRPWANIYATSATIGNITGAFTATSPFLVGGTATSTITGDGTASTIGGGLNITGTAQLGTLNGILKGSTGVVGAATAGVDYQSPYLILNGSNLYTSSTSWNVGIGTTVPVSKLEVSDGTNAKLTLTKTGANASFASIYNDGSNYLHLDTGVGGTFIQNADTFGYLDGSNTTWFMKILSTGNVLIGTTVDTSITGAKLRVNGGIDVAGTGTSYFAGNVGIGTSTPISRLTIVGSSTASTDRTIGIYNSANSPLFVAQNNVYIGIGTSTPSDRLVVANASSVAALTVIATSTPNLVFEVDDATNNQAFTVSSSSVSTFGGNVVMNGSTFTVSSPTTTFSGNIVGNFSLTGSSTVITPSIGGTQLAAGACASATSTVDTSVSSSTAAFITTPQNYPGDGIWWETYYSSSTSYLITTKVCAAVLATPTATLYVVKILK